MAMLKYYWYFKGGDSIKMELLRSTFFEDDVLGKTKFFHRPPRDRNHGFHPGHEVQRIVFNPIAEVNAGIRRV
jgi:hypothetical protein